MTSKACVLVVDDDPDLRETLAELLTASGYRVETAEHGKAALETMHDCKPCIVLLDLMMPVMDGWEVVDRMERDPELQGIPVCVVSAQAQVAPPKSVCVLPKPVKLARVLDVIKSYCGHAAT